MLSGRKIGFIGSGFMAEALVKGLLKSGMAKPADITMTDIRPDRLEYMKGEYSVQTSADNAKMIKENDMIILAVKPQDIRGVLEKAGSLIGSDAILISIAAGVRIEAIAKFAKCKIARAMPNTCAQAGEAVTALSFNQKMNENDISLVRDLFGSAGESVVVDEKLMDAVTAVSGSGPAYIYLVMESMIQAGIDLGLSPEDARLLVLQTVKGAAVTAMESGEKPEVLRERVTSPGGTTQAALKTLEAKGVRGAIMDAVKAAEKRSKELG